MFLAIWRAQPIEVLILAVLLLHIGLALFSLYSRRSLRMPRPDSDHAAPPDAPARCDGAAPGLPTAGAEPAGDADRRNARTATRRRSAPAKAAHK